MPTTPSSHVGDLPSSPSSASLVPLSSAALVSLESAARASLAQVALDREATFSRALEFMHTCHAALYTALGSVRDLQHEKEASEERLIGAETEASTSGDLVTRTEETRRFLVNRVRCAAWEKKSHFHLTALDHMLGNVQPALFDVATMLRGHLTICAMARSSMVAQANLQAHISKQLDTKELSFRRVKSLGEEMEQAHARSEEYKAILRDMKKAIGRDLERFIERRKRNKRLSSTPSSTTAAATSSETTTTTTTVTSPTSSSRATVSAHARTNSMFVPNITSPPEALRRIGAWDNKADAADADATSMSITLIPATPRSPTQGSSPVTPEQVSPSVDSPSSSPPRFLSPSPRSPDRMNSISPLGSSPPLGTTSLSWPPPTGASLLSAAADVWPDELASLASTHVEQVTHPTHAGASSHARKDDKDADITLLPPPPMHQVGGQSSGETSSTSSGMFEKDHTVLSSSAAQRTSGLAKELGRSTRSNSTPTSPTKGAVSSASSSPSSGPSRQGYLNIKLRYFQSLGQVKSNTSTTAASGGSSSSTPSSPRPIASTSALALVLPPAMGARRRGVRGGASGKDEIAPLPLPSTPLTTGARTSSSSAAASSPSSTVAGASVAALPAVRPRAMLSRSYVAGENKRWMLRPLPANTSRAAYALLDPTAESVEDMPELSPLHDENVHAPEPTSVPAVAQAASPTQSAPTSPHLGASATPSATNSAVAASPPAATEKKKWWSFFSRRKSAPPASPKGSSDSSKNAKSPAASSAASPLTSPLSSPSSPALSPLAPALVMPPVVEEVPRLLPEWSTLQDLYDEIADHATKQQAAWEALESVLDRRERVAAEERRRAIEREREERERQALMAAAAAAAQAALPKTSAPIAITNGPSSTSATNAHHVAHPRSPPPLMPSSHALSSLSMLTAGSLGGSGCWSSGSVSGSASVASTPPAVSPNADRPPRKSSVLSVLQSVPAPTLMATEFGSAAERDATAVMAAAHDAALSSSSAIFIPASLQPLAAALRTVVLEHLSRSLPSTPPAHSAWVPLNGHHGGGHARRASDSEARSYAGGHHTPHSAPPTMRSASFSSYIDAAAAAAAAASDEHEVDFHNAAQRRQMMCHSPPSPASLVC